MKKKIKYKETLDIIPTFKENDVLSVNLLNAATFASVFLCVEKKPSVVQLTEYYETA